MENMSWGLLVSISGLIATICTITGFFLGRKKEALKEGEREGLFSADISYIKNTMTDLKISVEKLDNKIDNNNEKINHEYTKLLIQVTQLIENYNNLNTRVHKLEKNKEV